MDIISYILSKKYTDKSLVGAGALKGANCTIQSIEPISGGHRITFKWILNDDTVETDTMDVMDGNDGLGIKSIDINSNNHLIVTYDDNTTHDAGLIESDGSTVTYTQTLQSGTKIGEITIDGTTTNLYAPSGGSGGEKEIVHVTELPVAPNIEDKIYEVGGSGTSYTLTMPQYSESNFQTYFSQFEFFSTVSTNMAQVSETATVIVTSEGGLKGKELAFIDYYPMYNGYSANGSDYQSSIALQEGDSLEVKYVSGTITHQYYLGDSQLQTLIEIKDGVEPTTYALSDLTDVTLTSAKYGDSLIFNGSKWVNGFPEDVVKRVLTMPTASISNEGEVVLYVGDTSSPFIKNHTYMCQTNGSTFWWADITVSGSGSSTLSELTDVDLSTLSDGDVLVYDNTNGKWVNESPEEGALVTAVLSKDTMPTASIEYEDIVVLYIGTTSANYTKGHSYLCVENSGSYSWTDITPSGGSSTLSDLTDVDLTNLSGGEILAYDGDESKWINIRLTLPHSEEKQFEVTTSEWVTDTTSQSGTTLYKKEIVTSYTIENVLSVNIGAISTLPTTAQQTAYDLVQYATVDSNTIYLYASAIPTDSFYINVIAEYHSNR